MVVVKGRHIYVTNDIDSVCFVSRCRQNPILMKILKYYTKQTKLPIDFVEGWRHYKHMGLPPIE